MGSVFTTIKRFTKKTVSSSIARFKQERKEAAKLKVETDKIRKDIRRREILRKAKIDEQKRVRGPTGRERKETRQRVSQFATNFANFYGAQTPQTQPRTQPRRKSTRAFQKELAKVRREAIKNELKRQARKQAIQKFRNQKIRTNKPRQRIRQPPPFIRFA